MVASLFRPGGTRSPAKLRALKMKRNPDQYAWVTQYMDQLPRYNDVRDAMKPIYYNVVNGYTASITPAMLQRVVKAAETIRAESRAHGFMDNKTKAAWPVIEQIEMKAAALLKRQNAWRHGGKENPMKRKNPGPVSILATYDATHAGAHPVLDQALALAEMLKSLPVPYVSTRISQLGGPARAAVGLSLSLDPRNTWSNGIFENSRHARFMLDCAEGSIAMIAGWKVPKFRKARFKTNADAVAKITKWLHEAEGVKSNPEPRGPRQRMQANKLQPTSPDGYYVVSTKTGNILSGPWRSEESARAGGYGNRKATEIVRHAKTKSNPRRRARVDKLQLYSAGGVYVISKKTGGILSGPWLSEAAAMAHGGGDRKGAALVHHEYRGHEIGREGGPYYPKRNPSLQWAELHWKSHADKATGQLSDIEKALRQHKMVDGSMFTPIHTRLLTLREARDTLRAGKSPAASAASAKIKNIEGRLAKLGVKANPKKRNPAAGKWVPYSDADASAWAADKSPDKRGSYRLTGTGSALVTVCPIKLHPHTSPTVSYLPGVHLNGRWLNMERAYSTLAAAKKAAEQQYDIQARYEGHKANPKKR